MRPRLILASASPRRRELLTEAGYEFEVASPRVEESSHGWLTIRELTIWNAARKAAAACGIARDAVILAADTLVTIDGEVLGKPADFDEAIRMLRRLSGRSHEVWTGVRINDARLRKTRSFHEMSRVHFRKLDDRAIRDYLGKIDPLDKAGAYAIQEWIGVVGIKSVVGDFYNVMGLPVSRVVRELRKFSG